MIAEARVNEIRVSLIRERSAIEDNDMETGYTAGSPEAVQSRWKLLVHPANPLQVIAISVFFETYSMYRGVISCRSIY